MSYAIEHGARQPGSPFAGTAGEALTSKENHLVTLASGEWELTDEIHDTPQGVVLEGVADGSTATIRPWIPGDEYKVWVSAAVASNAKLQLDASTPGQLITATTGPVVAVAMGATSGAGIAKVLAVGVLSGALQGCPAPTAVNATATQAAAELAPDAIITSTTGSAVVYTTRTGTLLSGDHPLVQIGQSFDFYVINTGSNNFTVTAGTDVTVTGAAVAGGSSGHFRAKKLTATTWHIYRLG